MRSRATTVTGVAGLLAGVVFGATPAQPEETTRPASEVSLTGLWTLDPEHSDDASEQVRKVLDGVHPGGFDPRRGPPPTGPGIDVMTPGDPGTGPVRGRPARLESGALRETLALALHAPPELTIAQRETLVLIQEGKDEGNVRAVLTDGERHGIEGTRTETRAHWDDGRLIVETWPDSGGRVTETFESAPDRSRLTVTLRIDAAGMSPLTVTRVYVPEDPHGKPAKSGQEKAQ